mmetsp:Transcript_60346/g.143788  ORF Transcript_60346/g.143788 Transcript_60346/m.143788 type:complete len:284 (-) Transcript_60346:698-1549(-)
MIAAPVTPRQRHTVAAEVRHQARARQAATSSENVVLRGSYSDIALPRVVTLTMKDASMLGSGCQTTRHKLDPIVGHGLHKHGRNLRRWHIRIGHQHKGTARCLDANCCGTGISQRPAVLCKNGAGCGGLWLLRVHHTSNKSRCLKIHGKGFARCGLHQALLVLFAQSTSTGFDALLHEHGGTHTRCAITAWTDRNRRIWVAPNGQCSALRAKYNPETFGFKGAREGLKLCCAWTGPFLKAQYYGHVYSRIPCKPRAGRCPSGCCFHSRHERLCQHSIIQRAQV